MMSKLVSIVYKPEAAGADPADRFLRVPLASAQLVAGYGIEGDRKGGSPNRQLNLMSFETLQALSEAGFNTRPGAMGEQLMVRGLDVGQLKAGDWLQIGEQACVEVVSHRNGDPRFEAIQGKARQLAAGRFGVMAKVVMDGRIQMGDQVKKICGRDSTDILRPRPLFDQVGAGQRAVSQSLGRVPLFLGEVPRDAQRAATHGVVGPLTFTVSAFQGTVREHDHAQVVRSSSGSISGPAPRNPKSPERITA